MALGRMQTRDVLFHSSAEVGFQGNDAGVEVLAHRRSICVGGELSLLTELSSVPVGRAQQHWHGASRAEP